MCFGSVVHESNPEVAEVLLVLSKTVLMFYLPQKKLNAMFLPIKKNQFPLVMYCH